LRNPEWLVEIGAPLSRLDSCKNDSLVEQQVQPPHSQRLAAKAAAQKSHPPPSPPTTSHPPEWLLRQPLPMAAIASARGRSAPLPREILQRYVPPSLPVAPSVRMDG